MIRPAAFALLLIATATQSAPVPKEARAGGTHVGKWQHVVLDPKDPGKRTPRGQTWFIGEDCNVAFHEMDYRGAPGRPTERLLFDPKTGEVDQSNIGGNGLIRTGRYKIEGDLLTINLNSNASTPRPKGMAIEPGSNLWTLQRVEDRR